MAVLLGLVVAAPMVADKPVPQIKAPKVVKKVEPRYTEEARTARIEGSVLLKAMLDETGRLHDIEVARGLGHGLDEAAIECVGQWKFEPASRDRTPYSVKVNLEINFRLPPAP